MIIVKTKVLFLSKIYSFNNEKKETIMRQTRKIVNDQVPGMQPENTP